MAHLGLWKPRRPEKAGRTFPLASEATITVELEDGDTRTFRRTTTQPVHSIKGQRPRTATSVS